jgi:hypothetical protein
MMKTKGESLPTLGNSRRNFGGSLERPSGTSNSALISEDLCIGLHSQVSGCANLTDWDNASLIMMFRQGLKENLKDELMCDGRELLNMKVLMEVAIEIDDKLYERAMEKRFDQPNHGREETFFGPTSGYYGGKSRSNTNRYSNPDYRGPAPMELDSTQRRKEKNPRGKQDNKPQNQATSSRDCCSRNLVDRRQINAMLREIPDSQLQRVLDWESSGKAPASTQEVNQILKEATTELPRTPYPHSPATDSDEEYGWKDFQECAEEITDQLEALASSSKEQQINQTMDECEEKLGSNATTEKRIPDSIMVQLNTVYLPEQEMDEAKDMQNSVEQPATTTHAGFTKLTNKKQDGILRNQSLHHNGRRKFDSYESS